MSHDLAGLVRPEGVYIIYSMSATCSDERIDNMGPLNQSRYWHPSAPLPEWVQTEGNSEYDYGYLTADGSSTIYLPADEAETQNVPSDVLTDDDIPGAYGFEFSIDGVDWYMKIGPSPYYHEEWREVSGKQEWNEDGTAEVWEVESVEIDRENVPERPQGRHRKWVADLTFEQWLDFANNFCIELLDNGMPERYTDTMGSLTEFGMIPAIAVDNTEGWGDNFGDPVIVSDFYCSFYGRPWDFSGDRGAMAWDAREQGARTFTLGPNDSMKLLETEHDFVYPHTV